MLHGGAYTFVPNDPPEDAVVLILLYVHCVVNSAEEFEMPRCCSSVWSELQGMGLAAALNSFPERPGVYRQGDLFITVLSGWFGVNVNAEC